MRHVALLDVRKPHGMRAPADSSSNAMRERATKRRILLGMMKFSFAAAVAVMALGCARAAESPPSHPAPLVHRFEHAEQWAKKFDDPARDAWQKPADVVRAMQITAGMTVADIGAGTGYFEPYLSRAVGAGGTVLAVDIEPDMVRYLQERATREHMDNVRALLAATDDPKLPSHAIDRILLVDTWHHIPDHAAYLAKLRDALAPHGRITFVEFTLDAPDGPPREHRIRPEALEEEVRRAEMTADRVEVGLPNQYVIVAH
jgi:SAM-dependent methyltransferase